MHEIDFRAWDEREDKMLSMIDLFHDLGLQNILIAFQRPLTRPKIKIMQYTGAKDIHDKKIYEGDLLKCGHHILCIESLDRFFWMKYDDQMRIDFSQYEIIGNSYENPEMV